MQRGRYELSFDEGPDPTMSLVVVSDQGTDEEALNKGAEACVRLYADPPELLLPGTTVPFCKHVSLQLQSEGRKSFFLEIDKSENIGLFTQHTAEEFDIKLTYLDSLLAESGNNDKNNSLISTKIERTWVAQHEHDDEVGSIAIECLGNVDPEKLNSWLGKLLAEKGVDIFRMKGFLSFAEESRRIVFQGVHMLFTSQPDRDWGMETRRNQLVFIGRNLDEEALRSGFDKCLI